MDILQKIVAHKKEEIESAKLIFPEDVLRESAELMRRRPLFFDAMKRKSQDRVNIIAEIKRASPSKGVIRESLDPARYAEYYQKGGACAISVLTDERFFNGSVQDFKNARLAADIPMLRKEFVISSYQIYESKFIGADAVLLIVKILSKQQLKDFLGLCDSLALDALVEINSQEELETATLAGAKLIGINNRNLRTFETDLGTSERLVRSLAADQIPVAASGVAGREDIARGLRAGLNNFLVGESIVRAENPREFLRELVTAPKNMAY